MTRLLVAVVLVFIICQLPNACLLLYYTHLSLAGLELSQADVIRLKIAGNLVNLLIQVNAAVNFVLYSAMSTKFRHVFLRILLRRGARGHAGRTNCQSEAGIAMTSYPGKMRVLVCFVVLKTW